ncbi:MAG: DUF4157 domain-containing protein, partial [Ilumatobacter sp.]|nr:DUF4157 domain-containing protein [Ilumatobacter sp.]
TPDDRATTQQPAADTPPAPGPRTDSSMTPAPSLGPAATPDPADVAAETAALLDSTSPDHTVISRSPDDRVTQLTSPTNTPGVDRPAAPEPALARASENRATPAPAPAPGADVPAATRPTAPDPAMVAAATAEVLASATPAGTVISRSPADLDRSPPADLGERFLRELGRSPDVAARELPRPFQPLATAITGSARQVRLSTDANTRRALDSVGKQAVTVGDTIHMARPVGNDARTHEVLAHELVHVANPSPVPRFFDDDHRGPEERMAEQVAQVIRRSPIVPASPVPSAGAAAAAGVASVAAAGRSGTSGSSGSSGTIRRSPIGGGSSPAAPLLAGEGSFTRDATVTRDAIIRREIDDTLSSTDGESETAGSGSAPKFTVGDNSRQERDWFDHLVERTVDRVVQHIERRVLTEFERRGGRHWRSF